MLDGFGRSRQVEKRFEGLHQALVPLYICPWRPLRASFTRCGSSASSIQTNGILHPGLAYREDILVATSPFTSFVWDTDEFKLNNQRKLVSLSLHCCAQGEHFKALMDSDFAHCITWLWFCWRKTDLLAVEGKRWQVYSSPAQSCNTICTVLLAFCGLPKTNLVLDIVDMTDQLALCWPLLFWEEDCQLKHTVDFPPKIQKLVMQSFCWFSKHAWDKWLQNIHQLWLLHRSVEGKMVASVIASSKARQHQLIRLLLRGMAYAMHLLLLMAFPPELHNQISSHPHSILWPATAKEQSWSNPCLYDQFGHPAL